VLFQRAGVDQDVIKIAKTENVEVFIESIVHKSLGTSWGIGKPKEYNQEFQQMIACPEGSFPLIILLDVDLVEAGSEVKTSEIFATSNLVQTFINSGQGCAVLNSDVVEGPIIDAEI